MTVITTSTLSSSSFSPNTPTTTRPTNSIQSDCSSCFKRLKSTKWTILRFGGLFLFSLLILVCVYATKKTSSVYSNNQSIESFYGVGDQVSPKDLWLIIELESDGRGLRTKLGKATAAHVCSAIRAAQSVGWNPLVIGGRSNCCKFSSCRHLDPGHVSSLNYSSAFYSIKKTKDLNNALRISGYLEAIKRGANFIFQAHPVVYYQANVSSLDYKNELKRQLRKMTLGISIGLVKETFLHDNKPKFDPYTHFGPYYKSSRNVKEYIHEYKICEVRPPSIEKFLDTDEFSLDEAAPPLTLPGSILAPFDTRNTFFGRDAFWSLLVLPNLPLKESYIIRSLFGQALLKSVGGSTKFSIAKQAISSSLDDITYYNSNLMALEDFIQDWNCEFLTVFDCLRSLVVDVKAHSELFTEHHVEIMKYWTQDLQSVGYSDVPLLSEQSLTATPCIGNDALTGVYFHSSSNPTQRSNRAPKKISLEPSENKSKKSEYEEFVFEQNITVRETFVHRLCPSIKPNGMSLETHHTTLLLIVNFHSGNYKSIPLFEVIYRHHFKNILYCGAPDSSVDEYREKYQGLSGFYFSFLPVSSSSSSSYECLLGAIEMGYSVEGFLMVTQETLVNSWNFISLNTSVIWHSNEHLRKISPENIGSLDGVEGESKILGSTLGFLKALEYLKDGLLDNQQRKRRALSDESNENSTEFLNESLESLETPFNQLQINLFGEIQSSSSRHNSSTRNVTELFFHPANFIDQTTHEKTDLFENSKNNVSSFLELMENIQMVYGSIGEKLDLWKLESGKQVRVSNGDSLTFVNDLVEKNIECDASSSSEICYLVSNFFEVLQTNENPNEFNLFYDDLPIYYVPVSHVNKDKLYLMANLFTKFQIQDEIAFPLLLRGLSSTSSWIDLRKSALINETVEIYSPDDLLDFNYELQILGKKLNDLERAHYLYPIRPETVLQNEILRNIICKNL